MKLAKLAGILLPLATAPTAQAQVVRGDIHVDANFSLPGEAVGSVDVFYDQLSPYGVWVDEPRMGGRVFIPDRDGFVPYREGHWQYTDLGFVWISNDPFAWATSHYGRWAYSQPYGRWVWLPDTEWGPAWVEWRESGDDFGWAPLAPTFAVDFGYQPPFEAWHYTHASHIFDVDLVRYYEPRDRVVVIHRQARPIEYRRQIGQTRVVVGPPPETLRAHRVAARPQKLEAKVIGRMSPTESRAAIERAQQRRQVVEQENRRRLDARPKIREVEKTVVKQNPQVVKRDQPKPQADRREQPKPQPQPERVRRDEPKPQPDRARPRPQPQPERVRRDEPKPQPERVRRDEPKPQPERVRRDEPKPQPRPERAQPQPQPKPERVQPEPKQPPAADRREQPKQKPAKPEKPRANDKQDDDR